MLPNESSIQEKYNSIEGVSPSDIQYDNECTLLEIHCDLDIPGFEDIGLDGEPTGIKLPYIITIDEGSGKVLSIYRNYKQEDPQKKEDTIFRSLSFPSRSWLLWFWSYPYVGRFIKIGYFLVTSTY